MILDANDLFDNKSSMAAFTVAGSPWLSANSLDTYAAGTPTAQGPGSTSPGAIGGTLLHDIGRGATPRLRVQITTAVTSGGAATVLCDVVMADDAALTTNKTKLVSSQAIAKATLVAGYKFRLAFPVGGISQRYLGVQYTVATADLTAGNVLAGLLGTMNSAAEDNNADILG